MGSFFVKKKISKICEKINDKEEVTKTMFYSISRFLFCLITLYYII